MAHSMFSALLKNVPADASVAIEGKSSAEFGGFIDTGSYTLNAALSGSLFGGMPDNKITALAGESGTGKTFFILGILQSWMKANPTGMVFYCDSESAVTNHMLTERGLDLNRIAKVEPETIEQFRQSVGMILDNYAESKASGKCDVPIMMVLDSLGNLSSEKEVTDVRDQNNTRDMTKAQLLRGTFRVLRLRLAKLGVPMIVANHTYSVVGAYIPTKALSGGGGLIYVSDSIAMLSKSKERDAEKTVIGNIIKVVMIKSRLSRELTEAEVRISYTGGLDRYHGVLDMAVEAGLVTKTVGRYTFPGEKVSVTASKIAETPGKYFTDEFLKKLDATYVKPNFSYGGGAANSSPATDTTTENI